MKTILCLIGVATLFLTNGCVVRTHDRGAYHGPREYERGEYRSYPDRRYDDRGYWDEDGYYHRYRRPIPESRRQHYPYSWDDRRY